MSAFDVALRKESVDRNNIALANIRVYTTSLSARRAWIEICRACRSGWLLASLSARRAWIEIAPRWRISGCTLRSLSARRAWIEIVITAMTSQISVVALRKESVDRNPLQIRPPRS